MLLRAASTTVMYVIKGGLITFMYVIGLNFFYSRFAHYTKYTEKRVVATKKNTILIGRGHQKSTFAGGQNNNVVITNFIQENKTCMYIETMQCSIKPN